MLKDLVQNEELPFSFYHKYKLYLIILTFIIDSVQIIIHYKIFHNLNLP